jgi:hypothetical protein
MNSHGFRDLEVSETLGQIKGKWAKRMQSGTVTVTLAPIDGNRRTRLDVVAQADVTIWSKLGGTQELMDRFKAGLA